MTVTSRNELEIPREHSFTYHVHQADQLRIWEPPFDHPDKEGCQWQNLTVQTSGGELALYGLSSRQLADLYVQLGQILGKFPTATVHHLKQARDLLNKLIGESEPAETSGQWASNQSHDCPL